MPRLNAHGHEPPVVDVGVDVDVSVDVDVVFDGDGDGDGDVYDLRPGHAQAPTARYLAAPSRAGLPSGAQTVLVLLRGARRPAIAA